MLEIKITPKNRFFDVYSVFYTTVKKAEARIKFEESRGNKAEIEK